jgi:hypothetical protein
VREAQAVAESPASASPRWRRWSLRLLEFGVLFAVLLFTLWLSDRWLLPNGDVDEYYAYALAFWTQHPLLHALPAEYPPLAIIPFTLTLLPSLSNYHLVFAAWMAALVLLGYAGFLRYAGRSRALVYIVYLLLGAVATLLARFDIVPALVTLGALLAAERRRFELAYALVAAGVLLKLYPAFLLPVIVIEHWRYLAARAVDEGAGETPAREAWRRLRGHPALAPVARGAALCLGLIGVGFAGAFILNPAGALSTFTYAGGRPLQAESTPASLLWLGSLFGIPAFPNYSYVSLNLVGPLDGVLKQLSAVALVGGCLIVYWRQARGKLTVGRAVIACLCVVLVTNKIFSPQYLIWVLPVVAYIEGFSWAWITICFLTTLDFPFIYQMRHPILTVPYSWQFLPVVAVRNGLLLWMTFRAIIGPEVGSTHAADVAMGAEPISDTIERSEDGSKAPAPLGQGI